MPTTTARKTRVRNPRVVTVATLRQLKQRLGALVDMATYHSGSRVTEYGSDANGSAIATQRPRRPDEYAERMPVFWQRVVAECDSQIDVLTKLRRYAASQYDRLADEG
jgi:hypothetical protein